MLKTHLIKCSSQTTGGCSCPAIGINCHIPPLLIHERSTASSPAQAWRHFNPSFFSTSQPNSSFFSHNLSGHKSFVVIIKQFDESNEVTLDLVVKAPFNGWRFVCIAMHSGHQSLSEGVVSWHTICHA